MTISLSNTLTRKKEEFVPLKKGQVSIYTCGPTVYHYLHIGNIRAYTFADTLKRVFLFNNYKVNHVMNITDVGHLTDDGDAGEDKLEKGAIREKKTVWEVADYYTKSALSDIKETNIIMPDTICKATDHIKEMIAMVLQLEKKGYTYTKGGNVYFDSQKFKDYGKLAKLNIGQDKEQKARVEEDKNKKHPYDFVLWFTKYKYTSHAMQWDSPWGRGFPGWHIECSAMSTKYLGDYFDIHTGGIDLIPVHHTNEIAQNECALGHQTINYWLHNNFIIDKTGKMAKSKGEFLTLQTLKDKGYHPLDYRYLLLGTHYKKELMFSWEALDAAKNARWKLHNKVLELNQAKKRKPDTSSKRAISSSQYMKRFTDAINDDLNTPQALAVLWDLLKDNAIAISEKHALIMKFDEVFGLKLEDVAPEELPKTILKIQEQRDAARKKKDFKTADTLRDQITSKGYEVLDEKDESFVRKK